MGLHTRQSQQQQRNRVFLFMERHILRRDDSQMTTVAAVKRGQPISSILLQAWTWEIAVTEDTVDPLESHSNMLLVIIIPLECLVSLKSETRM